MNQTKQKPKENSFVDQVKKLCEGLYYISETEAEILPFAGAEAKAVTKDEILRQTKRAPLAPVEERNFAEIFTSLMEMQDWFGDEEKETANRFRKLKVFLEENLKDLKIFKIGNIELDVYAVGLDREGRLMGIQTKALET